MAFGVKARDPSRPYLVYAFEWRGKVFYVGIGGVGHTRHSHRWSFVKNLVRHERAGTLKPDKARELARTSNAVIASLVRAGLEEHKVLVLWEGLGREAALAKEKELIAHYAELGCELANSRGSASKSIHQVLRYLGFQTTTPNLIVDRPV